VGRSSPYFDLTRDAADAGPGESILVRGGFQLAARADLPIAGPWRARVEGSSISPRSLVYSCLNAVTTGSRAARMAGSSPPASPMSIAYMSAVPRSAGVTANANAIWLNDWKFIVAVS
jgi:hypothetical protein